MDNKTLMIIGLIVGMGILLAVGVKHGTNVWMGEMLDLHDQIASGEVEPDILLQRIAEQNAEAQARAEQQAIEAAKPPSMVPVVVVMGAMGGLLIFGPIAIRRMNESGPPRQPRVVSEIPVPERNEAPDED